MQQREGGAALLQLVASQSSQAVSRGTLKFAAAPRTEHCLTEGRVRILATL
jgi:hypothetical protein